MAKLDRLVVNLIAGILGDRLPAAALLAMPGTKTIYAIAEAIAEELDSSKHTVGCVCESSLAKTAYGVYHHPLCPNNDDQTKA